MSTNVGCNCDQLRFAEELGDGRVNAIGINRESGKSSRSETSCYLGKLANLAPGVPGTAWGNDRLDLTARRECLSKCAELGLAESISHVAQL